MLVPVIFALHHTETNYGAVHLAKRLVVPLVSAGIGERAFVNYLQRLTKNVESRFVRKAFHVSHEGSPETPILFDYHSGDDGKNSQIVASRAKPLKEKRFGDFFGRKLLGFFERFGEGGHDFEDVADDAVIGNFENGRVGILVDGNDGARAFHSNDMLNCAADAQSEIEFWRDGLAGAADLPLHGEPARSEERRVGKEG